LACLHEGSRDIWFVCWHACTRVTWYLVCMLACLHEGHVISGLYVGMLA